MDVEHQVYIRNHARQESAKGQRIAVYQKSDQGEQEEEVCDNQKELHSKDKWLEARG